GAGEHQGLHVTGDQIRQDRGGLAGGRTAQGLLAAVAPLGRRPTRTVPPTGRSAPGRACSPIPVRASSPTPGSASSPAPGRAASPLPVRVCSPVLVRTASPIHALPRARFPQPDGQPRPRGAVLGDRLDVPA